MSRKAFTQSTANLVDADTAAIRSGMFHSGRALLANTPVCATDGLVDLVTLVIPEKPVWPVMAVTVATSGLD